MKVSPGGRSANPRTSGPSGAAGCRRPRLHAGDRASPAHSPQLPAEATRGPTAAAPGRSCRSQEAPGRSEPQGEKYIHLQTRTHPVTLGKVRAMPGPLLIPRKRAARLRARGDPETRDFPPQRSRHCCLPVACAAIPAPPEETLFAVELSEVPSGGHLRVGLSPGLWAAEPKGGEALGWGLSEAPQPLALPSWSRSRTLRFAGRWL